jgi:hypothetical protein
MPAFSPSVPTSMKSSVQKREYTIEESIPVQHRATDGATLVGYKR